MKNWDDESADSRAEAIFHENPDKALAGGKNSSAEGDLDASPIMSLITQDQEKFIYLASLLPPVLQDIFYQYYLLGRTHSQIGLVLFPRRTVEASRVCAKKASVIGLKGLCAVIKFGGQPSDKQAKKFPKLADAYYDMMKFQKAKREVKVKASSILGDFEVQAEKDLSQLFAPSWSVLSGRGSGNRAY